MHVDIIAIEVKLQMNSRMLSRNNMNLSAAMA